jgi:hypothetical protein
VNYLFDLATIHGPLSPGHGSMFDAGYAASELEFLVTYALSIGDFVIIQGPNLFPVAFRVLFGILILANFVYFLVTS